MSKLLVVDDEPRTLLLLKSLLKANSYEVDSAASGPEAINILKSTHYDILITDLRMAPMDGLTLFKEVHGLFPKMPVILLTAYASVETAINAMKQGIFDYMTKPFKVDEMIATLKHAEERINQNTLASSSSADAPLRYIFENVIASSPMMNHVCEIMQKVAPTIATILINGEPGTGKEVIAKTIHNNSPRKSKPWIAINCAALQENQLEFELFGCEKNTIQENPEGKPGLFELANNGTIYLEEISALPLILQGRLLQALQDHEVKRVGGTKAIPIDVRVIAANCSNLEQKVVEGTFRADLYYRLAIISLEIPPLRDRHEDILPLIKHFIKMETPKGKEIPEISPDVAKTLLEYAWPGNVRELENVIKHALTFHDKGPITDELIPPKILAKIKEQKNNPDKNISTMPLKGYLRQKEQEYLKHILESTNGDKTKAAETLQVSLATLYRKLSDEEK